MIKSRLAALRALMVKNGIDAYIIPTCDFHLSEYVGDYFKSRKYMSGFTGSAGTLVVMAERALLWTDSRYYLQAAQQLAGSTVELMRSQDEDVPSIEQFLLDNLPIGGTIGADGRTVSATWVSELKEWLVDKSPEYRFDVELVGELWKERPALSDEPIMILGTEYSGEDAASKLARLREAMRDSDADAHILTSLDDIAWLYNIRGMDVLYTPVALCYTIVEQQHAYLFIDERKLIPEQRRYFLELGVELLPYDYIYEFAKRYARGDVVMIDRDRINQRVLESLNGAQIVDETNPTLMMKAVKNDVELKNLEAAVIKDGLAVTRFMRYVKENVARERMSELGLGKVLLELRRQQQGFICPSFGTICGYNAHGAIVHYEATADSDVTVYPNGLLLVDSGGQYLEGTTDITRTLALGPLSDMQKKHFTLVLRAALALMDAKFIDGCRCYNLDMLPREVFWKEGLNYLHGTGHGVGYLLSVHEGPNGFKYDRPADPVLSVMRPGMVTSDEPGIYIEGEYGIRTENLIVCRRDRETEYGRFLKFDAITYAPIDLDAVDAGLMNADEKRCLNDYHKLVYSKLAPFMDNAERAWLKAATREI